MYHVAAILPGFSGLWGPNPGVALARGDGAVTLHEIDDVSNRAKRGKARGGGKAGRGQGGPGARCGVQGGGWGVFGEDWNQKK